MEENITTNAVEVVANESVAATTNSGKKSGLVIGIVTVVALGATFGTYKLIKFIRRKKAAKKVEQSAE